MKREVEKKFLIITLFFFFVMVVYYCFEESKQPLVDNFVSFNIKSGFYDHTIYVKLNKNIDLPIGTKILYTVNGDDPTIEKSDKYTGAIKLEQTGDGITIYPLKVVAYYRGTYSNVLEETYILDNNISENDISIISITSDSKNLYDYETGIMVGGKTYDDNAKNGATGYIPGNYNNRSDEWLRDAHLIMFDENGNVKLNKNIKLGISGGTSSAMNPKSLKIINNDALENKDKFNINLYNSNYSYNDYSMTSTYKSLRLRSGSQDRSNGNIRSSLMSRLASESNFDGCTTTKRVLIFLNGSYYGIFDIQQTYSSSTLTKKYALPNSDSIYKYKSSEKNVIGHSGYAYEYFNSDLNDLENIKKLEELVDMDNYLLYFAIEILVNNTDWPQNNFEMWKYTGEYNGVNKYTDGRIRFLIYDNDIIYYSDKSHQFFDGISSDNFRSLMDNLYRQSNSTFKNIISSKYYRDKYIMLTQDLLNTSFKEENVLKIVDEEVKIIDVTYKRLYSSDDYKDWQNKIELLKDEVKKRDDNLIEDFKIYFNLEETHKVNVKANEGVQINFTNQELYQNQIYTNNYYKDIDLRYNYKIYPGYKFKYWLVNGEKIYDSELVIESDKYRDFAEINIEAVAEYQTNANHLLISEVYAKGDSDWIKITNASKNDIKLDNYYLLNNDQVDKKYKLPSIILKSNDSIVVYGSKNYYAIGDYICNFNIKEGEYVELLLDDKVVDAVYVPRMSDIETYKRYDNSNTFKFVLK